MVKPDAAQFPTTRWSHVADAGDPASPRAREALAALCAAYWFPIYAFIRRKGHDPDDATDLTQDFFARLLQRGTFAAADPSRGRFRTFLLTDCQHFLADRRDHQHALRRGGGRTVLSIDARDAEGRLCHEPVDSLTPDRVFDRVWAETLLSHVLTNLGNEYRAGGRGDAFEALKPALTGRGGGPSSAELAARLGTTVGGARVALHRLRQHKALLHREIEATLGNEDGTAVEDELRALFAALAG